MSVAFQLVSRKPVLGEKTKTFSTTLSVEIVKGPDQTVFIVVFQWNVFLCCVSFLCFLSATDTGHCGFVFITLL